MSFRLYTRGTIAVLKLSEGFMSHGELQRVREAVRKSMCDGNRKLVVDLHSTTHVNSMMIGAFVEMYTSYTNVGGRVVFANLTRRVEVLFEVLKLDRVFEIAASVGAAFDLLEVRDVSTAAR